MALATPQYGQNAVPFHTLLKDEAAADDKPHESVVGRLASTQAATLRRTYKVISSWC